MEKIIVIDFAGTLVKTEIIEEANEFRAKVLEKSLPTKEQHANPEEFYKVNREFVEKLTGIQEDMKILYRENDLDVIELKGEQVQNQISTNLFQIGMYMVAKKHKSNIFKEGFIEQLQKMQESGYKLALVCGVRTDIISGMFRIAEMPIEFNYIYGQPPILGEKNQQNAIKELQTKGSIEYNIGDKISDLERTKSTNAKTIFVKWGHPSGGEEEFADHVIEKPEELEDIIK